MNTTVVPGLVNSLRSLERHVARAISTKNGLQIVSTRLLAKDNILTKNYLSENQPESHGMYAAIKCFLFPEWQPKIVSTHTLLQYY